MTCFNSIFTDNMSHHISPSSSIEYPDFVPYLIHLFDIEVVDSVYRRTPTLLLKPVVFSSYRLSESLAAQPLIAYAHRLN